MEPIECKADPLIHWASRAAGSPKNSGYHHQSTIILLKGYILERVA